VHSELGQLGPEGVEAALALNAQRDPCTAADYQSAAVERALRRQGQDMVDGLLAECWEP
jgi:DNA-binding FrmR family transcriptional regulator